MTDNVSFPLNFIKTSSISSKQEILNGCAWANVGEINMAVRHLDWRPVPSCFTGVKNYTSQEVWRVDCVKHNSTKLNGLLLDGSPNWMAHSWMAHQIEWLTFKLNGHYRRAHAHRMLGRTRGAQCILYASLSRVRLFFNMAVLPCFEQGGER